MERDVVETKGCRETASALPLLGRKPEVGFPQHEQKLRPHLRSRQKEHEEADPESGQTLVKTHKEFVHTTCLIVATTMRVRLRIGKNLNSVDNIVRMCESINLAP